MLLNNFEILVNWKWTDVFPQLNETPSDIKTGRQAQAPKHVIWKNKPDYSTFWFIFAGSDSFQNQRVMNGLKS